MQFRTVGDFAEMPAFKAMTKVNRFNRLSRVEVHASFYQLYVDESYSSDSCYILSY